MMTKSAGPSPSIFVADTAAMILPLKGKHESGREETHTLEQDEDEMMIEVHISPVTESLKVTV